MKYPVKTLTSQLASFSLLAKILSIFFCILVKRPEMLLVDGRDVYEYPPAHRVLSQSNSNQSCELQFCKMLG